ncbi:DNA cytosine methyltransferase [Burkholderia ubonensis]|uniref:DNA cytosine methyltransferase n=1 Tax=Burkholderia ubonensis TaxID=101571 RepID=UPI0009B2F47A|nr:DNA cytosine methyltransferase [Burkholderia ubonensis]
MRKIIDLFAGAGGLSLGAARAGFNVCASVEIDPFALAVHKRNFPTSVHIDRSVAKLTGPGLLKEANVRPGELAGLIGGPPCQGFSSIGRRDADDERNDMFGHFFRLVASTQPAFFVAENVPGILDVRYDQIRATAFAKLRNRYRLLEPLIVSANKFGAPTTRTRIFFLGYQPDRFREELTEDSFSPSEDQQIVCVRNALQGLPIEIDENWQSAESGWQAVDNIGDDWFGNRVRNAVPLGVGHPASLERFYEKGQVSGCMGTKHTPDVVARFLDTEPGERDPISRAPRLHPERFCPTLRAGTSRERGSYQAVRPIHYEQPRVITPREAARLQGFPDWFVFDDTKWHSFRQIGNSVSPLVAEFILHKLSSALR